MEIGALASLVSGPLRIATWLAPGIPNRLFEVVTEHLQDALGRPCSLDCEDRHSGPIAARDDVFAAETVDLGFLCAPSYLWLRTRQPPSVVLIPSAPVPDDPRAEGRPVYFCEIMVRHEEPVERFHHRCDEFRRRMAEARDGSTTVVVTHWGVVRALTGLRVENGKILRHDPTLARLEPDTGTG